MATAVRVAAAYPLHLGGLRWGLMFTVIFVVPMVARRLFGLNEVFAFWFAYVITRPLGASYADWLGVPQSLGGLNYGRGTVAVGLTIAIIAWVGYLWATKGDVEHPDAPLLATARSAPLSSSARPTPLPKSSIDRLSRPLPPNALQPPPPTSK